LKINKLFFFYYFNCAFLIHTTSGFGTHPAILNIDIQVNIPVMTIQRRDFLRNMGLVAGALTLRLPGMAHPFTMGRMMGGEIPPDKQLDPKWVRGLYERGTVTTYLKSKNELQYIGMPVGGITCGTVYLGGDGRLWLWDIFNKNQEGIEPKEVDWPYAVHAGKKIRSRDGACYVEPSRDIRPLDQGFAVKLTYNGQTIIKRLHADDWAEIAFEATYPMATVRYTDPAIPVEIKLEAYSPFIPLNEDDSGLPVTIFSFELINKSKQPVTAVMLGWLENKTGIHSADNAQHERKNTRASKNGWIGVESTIGDKAGSATTLKNNADYGSLCIAALQSSAFANVQLVGTNQLTAAHFEPGADMLSSAAIEIPLIGSVGSQLQILPGKSSKANFAISWYFPNLQFGGIEGKGRYYANRFTDAAAVMDYVKTNFARLSGQSKLWHQTWYNATLPWWFLERTFANTSTLATTTSHRFTSGRFYAWEGVGACEGTCTHVWQYAQAVGRVFPALERDTRERVDLALAMMPDGGIKFRGEAEKRPAIDGQAGTILRIYREHQMSKDDAFLQKNWVAIKKATQFVLDQDRNHDGMEDTPMENTLDAVWDGEIAWIVGLCIAAVKAGELMAIEVGDAAFAKVCATYVADGRRNMETQLFNGEYFIHQPDKVKGRANLGSYNTCHIDQVYGQSWAFQVGMPRVLDQEKTLSALRSLWKYNFTPDVGPYIATHKGWRPYALAGEGGMIMNTNPRNEPRPYGENQTWQLGYFHECMSGFEHQVAAHMMAEGMTDEALVLTRAIHDRYHAVKRNPFNEIECSDHYARAMASYGTFITACGFEYHGPKGYIKFAPKWNKAAFKAPFITAEGWGAYRQQEEGQRQVHEIAVKQGSLQLKELGFECTTQRVPRMVTVSLAGQQLPATFAQEGNTIRIQLKKKARIILNNTLKVVIV
jgi:non-lysosomal glucosylceramidase